MPKELSDASSEWESTISSFVSIVVFLLLGVGACFPNMESELLFGGCLDAALMKEFEE